MDDCELREEKRVGGEVGGGRERRRVEVGQGSSFSVTGSEIQDEMSNET